MSFINDFFEYTEQLPSPALFRKWAGIALVAGALERKVWVRSLGTPLYPNLYTIFVAPPGVGKTVLTSRIWALWQELEDHHVASSSVTKASLIDELSEAVRNIIRPKENPSVVTFNSLLVSSNELGVLIPGYENDFMNTLTDLYDGHAYSERRRSRDIKVKMEHPQLNLVAATTPSYLNNVLPEGAWDQGFISRVILVYSGETILRPLFADYDEDTKRFDSLARRLRRIGSLYGEMRFTDEAAELITEWHLAKGPPTPDHPRLVHYNTRRTAHLLKLCMVASAARGDTLQVTADHFREALDWLIEVEAYMPDIFKAMKAGGDSKAIEAAWHFTYEHWVKKKEPIPETRLIYFLQERIPAHNVQRVLEVMVKAEILIQQIGTKGERVYKPAPRRAT